MAHPFKRPVMRITRFAATAIAAAAVLALPAFAQFDPGASADLGVGMGQTAMSQSILSGTRRLSAPEGRSAAPRARAHRGTAPSTTATVPGSARGPSPEQVRARGEQLRPEYERRLRTDGKASADSWLARTAYEMGRREGAAARRPSR